MGQAAALSGLIGLTGPLAIVLKPPPVTWLGLISANIGYFIYAPFLRRHSGLPAQNRYLLVIRSPTILSGQSASPLLVIRRRAVNRLISPRPTDGQRARWPASPAF